MTKQAPKQQRQSDVTELRIYLTDHAADLAVRFPDDEDDGSFMDQIAIECGRQYDWSEDRATDASQRLLMQRMRAEGVI